MNTTQSASSYLRHLPAIFQEDPFLGRFLLAFESILTGEGDVELPSLFERIRNLAEFFDPTTADEEFLPWLASWVALSLRADWDERTKRAFIQQIVPLYRLRGTKVGLQSMLELYTGEPVEVTDEFDESAHFFQVQLRLTEPDPNRFRQKQQIARAIIDQEKPAHTFYALQVAVPTMRLVSLALQAREKKEKGVEPPLLTLGDNTVLGTEISSR